MVESNRLLLLGLVLSLLTHFGCAAPMEAEFTERQTFCRVAANRVLLDLSIPAADGPDGSLTGILADGRSLRVDFESLGEEATRITVTIGATGDAMNSIDAVRILEQIGKALSR